MEDCTISYKEHKKAIKGGNKKKLIHNIQQKKKKCEANDIPNEEYWSVKHSNNRIKIKKINIEDTKKSKFLKTILQGNSINYKQQELAFWLAGKLKFKFAKHYDKDINYIKLLEKAL